MYIYEEKNWLRYNNNPVAGIIIKADDAENPNEPVKEGEFCSAILCGINPGDTPVFVQSYVLRYFLVAQSSAMKKIFESYRLHLFMYQGKVYIETDKGEHSYFVEGLIFSNYFKAFDTAHGAPASAIYPIPLTIGDTAHVLATRASENGDDWEDLTVPTIYEGTVISDEIHIEFNLPDDTFYINIANSNEDSFGVNVFPYPKSTKLTAKTSSEDITVNIVTERNDTYVDVTYVGESFTTGEKNYTITLTAGDVTKTIPVKVVYESE